MDHLIRIVRTDNDDPAVPASFHATCSCGWALESHDHDDLQARVHEHECCAHEIPVPASPTPVQAIASGDQADKKAAATTSAAAEA